MIRGSTLFRTIVVIVLKLSFYRVHHCRRRINDSSLTMRFLQLLTVAAAYVDNVIRSLKSVEKTSSRTNKKKKKKNNVDL